MDDPIIIYRKKGKQLWYILGALLFTLLCGLLFFADSLLGPDVYQNLSDDMFFYWLFKAVLFIGFFFFACCTGYYIKEFTHPRPVLTVDEAGITDYSSALGLGFLPWKDVRRIYAAPYMRQVYIEVELANEEAYLGRLKTWKRKTIAANKKLGLQAVSIVLNATGHDPYVIAPLMQEMLEQAQQQAL